MKISILAIGKAGRGPESELIAEYAKRLPWPVTIHELEDKKPDATGRQDREAAQIAARIPEGAYIIALDERGKQFSSRQFADVVGKIRDEGYGTLCFLIGGADGHTDETRSRANMLLSLSSLTWPHMLARVMLVEQLYRAASILSGHPYHRD